MDNNNPAEMSNNDLEKDMQNRNQDDLAEQREKTNKSTAAEGDLIDPSEDKHSIHNVRPVSGEERDLDDLVHSAADDEDSQDGALPDPEEIDNWERRDDPNKISG